MDGALAVGTIVLLGLAAWFFVRSRRLGAAEAALREEKQRLEHGLVDLGEQHRTLAQRLSAVSSENETLRVERTRLDANMSALADENRALTRYRPLLDLERALESTRGVIAAERARAQQLLDAERAQTSATIAAQLAAAGRESESVIQRAREQATVIDGEAAARAQASSQQSAAIVKQAHERAAEIAGEALEAKSNLDAYRCEALALKNIIEGYGHEYIVPGHALLDDLAEALGYAEAGENLKAARERTRTLVKGDRAATCDYVEANRRETAIAFVVDAFNGKVDSILARVKAATPESCARRSLTHGRSST
jgi:hypothetical protein